MRADDAERGRPRQASRLVAEQEALRRLALLVADGVPADELFGAVVEEAGGLFGGDLAVMTHFPTAATIHVVAAWAADGELPDAAPSAAGSRSGRPRREGPRSRPGSRSPRSRGRQQRDPRRDRRTAAARAVDLERPVVRGQPVAQAD
jgi:hypothetical protein